MHPIATALVAVSQSRGNCCEDKCVLRMVCELVSPILSIEWSSARCEVRRQFGI